MSKKTLIGNQIYLILWQLAAAIAAIEAYNQFNKDGIGSLKGYFFTAIFFVCATMFFVKRRHRNDFRK